MPLFKKLEPSDYVCFTWFERDRANVRLETPQGREIFDLWDDDFHAAVESGYLTLPKGPRATDKEWQPHAVAYAQSLNLI